MGADWLDITAWICGGLCSFRLLADNVFTPLLLEGGALSETVGRLLGIGPGRGIGLLIVLAGILLSVTSGILLCMKSIHRLENGGIYES